MFHPSVKQGVKPKEETLRHYYTYEEAMDVLCGAMFAYGYDGRDIRSVVYALLKYELQRCLNIVTCFENKYLPTKFKRIMLRRMKTRINTYKDPVGRYLKSRADQKDLSS